MQTFEAGGELFNELAKSGEKRLQSFDFVFKFDLLDEFFRLQGQLKRPNGIQGSAVKQIQSSGPEPFYNLFFAQREKLAGCAYAPEIEDFRDLKVGFERGNRQLGNERSRLVQDERWLRVTRSEQSQ
jgi:hypothetical protein